MQRLSKTVIKLDFDEVGCFLVKLIYLIVGREGLRTNHGGALENTRHHAIVLLLGVIVLRSTVLRDLLASHHNTHDTPENPCVVAQESLRCEFIKPMYLHPSELLEHRGQYLGDGAAPRILIIAHDYSLIS